MRLACTVVDAVFSAYHVKLFAAAAGDAHVDAPDAKLCVARDEDCDDILDMTDFCPADSKNNTDTDADGVGDLCDTDDALEPNRIAFFDGFNDATGGWTQTGVWN